MIVSFRVFGHAMTKGSKTPFVPPHPVKRTRNGNCCGGRAVLTDARREKSRLEYALWEEAVERAARKAIAGRAPMDGPINVAAKFYLARPKHETKAERLRVYHIGRLDGDKLLRAVLDPMVKAGLLVDDSRVVSFDGTAKYYVPWAPVPIAPRVEVIVTQR